MILMIWSKILFHIDTPKRLLLMRQESLAVSLAPIQLDTWTSARGNCRASHLYSWHCDTVKYLGAHVVADKGISFSASGDLTSFYRASNAILRAVNKPSDEISLQLLYSNCIPTLTYACAVKEYSTKQMQECNTAVNDALRLIFGYNRWESVRTLRESFGYSSLTELFAIARKRFYGSLPHHRNNVISSLSRNLAIEEKKWLNYLLLIFRISYFLFISHCFQLSLYCWRNKRAYKSLLTQDLFFSLRKLRNVDIYRFFLL